MSERTLVAAVETIRGGRVLHVRAERLAGKRRPRRDPRPAVDFTVGPDGRGGFLLVDYARVRSGLEDRYDTAEEAIRQARCTLGGERIEALRQALISVHGAPERPASLMVEDARIVAAGARMRRAFAGRPDIVGPLFGPGFGPFGRW